jgi:hypothetical protein
LAYRKTFDIIFRQNTNEGWRAQRDDLRTSLSDFVVSLAQVEFAAGLNL